MAIDLVPLPLPASIAAAKFEKLGIEFGREVKGIDPGNLSDEDFKKISDHLYTVRFLLIYWNISELFGIAWCPSFQERQVDAKAAIGPYTGVSLSSLPVFKTS